MKATDLYSRIYEWCKAVLGDDAVVYRAYQNMPMRKGHVLVIDPAPRIDRVGQPEVGNPGDALHGALVMRMRGAMTLTEIGGYDYLYKLIRNINNPFASSRLQSTELAVVGTQGPVSVPNIDDASSEWYAEQTLVLSLEWVDVDDTPVEGDVPTSVQSIREVVATQVRDDGSDGEVVDVVDDTEE